MLLLQNKTVLVTGAARGLNAAIAKSLSQQGANVIIHYFKSRKEAEELSSSLNGRVMVLQADLTNEEEVKLMFQKIKEEFDGVDILINGVGNFFYESILNLSTEKFKDIMESNIYSIWHTTQQVLPYMVEKKWGRIINFGCAGAEFPKIRKNLTPYYLAKLGVIMLSKNFATELVKDNITINTISPGILESSIVKPKTPTNSCVRFEEVINVIIYLLSLQAEKITGVNIEISGGWTPGFE